MDDISKLTDAELETRLNRMSDECDSWDKQTADLFLALLREEALRCERAKSPEQIEADRLWRHKMLMAGVTGL